MTVKFDDLLAEALRLSAQDRERLLARLNELQTSAASAAQDRAATSADTDERNAMTHVTVALPDELVQQAQDAGLLAQKSLEDLIRKALQDHLHESSSITPPQERRLKLKNGYLVVEALPGEKPITTEEVKKIWQDMEW